MLREFSSYSGGKSLTDEPILRTVQMQQTVASHGGVSLLAAHWECATQFVMGLNLELNVTHSFFLLGYPIEDNMLEKWLSFS